MENTCTEKSVKAAPDTQDSSTLPNKYAVVIISKLLTQNHMCGIMDPPGRVKWNQTTLALMMHLCSTHRFGGQQNTHTHTGGAGRTGCTRRPDLDFMVWRLLWEEENHKHI